MCRSRATVVCSAGSSAPACRWFKWVQHNRRTTMGLRITQVDAFTAEPFGGNPAAVCILPEPRPTDWMQAVASEMNLSETAFLVRDGDGYNLRWFTPQVEVDLCGHATLAGAHVLW